MNCPDCNELVGQDAVRIFSVEQPEPDGSILFFTDVLLHCDHCGYFKMRHAGHLHGPVIARSHLRNEKDVRTIERRLPRETVRFAGRRAERAAAKGFAPATARRPRPVLKDSRIQGAKDSRPEPLAL